MSESFAARIERCYDSDFFKWRWLLLRNGQPVPGYSGWDGYTVTKWGARIAAREAKGRYLAMRERGPQVTQVKL